MMTGFLYVFSIDQAEALEPAVAGDYGDGADGDAEVVEAEDYPVHQQNWKINPL